MGHAALCALKVSRDGPPKQRVLSDVGDIYQSKALKMPQLAVALKGEYITRVLFDTAI